jgi:hypothetical protein
MSVQLATQFLGVLVLVVSLGHGSRAEAESPPSVPADDEPGAGEVIQYGREQKLAISHLATCSALDSSLSCSLQPTTDIDVVITAFLQGKTIKSNYLAAGFQLEVFTDAISCGATKVLLPSNANLEQRLETVCVGRLKANQSHLIQAQATKWRAGSVKLTMNILQMRVSVP